MHTFAKNEVLEPLQKKAYRTSRQNDDSAEEGFVGFPYSTTKP
jgi:hypothetical protein